MPAKWHVMKGEMLARVEYCVERIWIEDLHTHADFDAFRMRL